jgi:hypothetical protein
MQQSMHMRMINETSDEEFITYCMYVRDFTIPTQHKKIIHQLIQNRCRKLGYSFDFGCCGTNVLIKEHI